ncbi:MAG: PEP-CTERM sorting domain-containing protein [Kiritimatiellae bacterium]|nr:PEP-CTERM sorting domain-containing protein [Kiritimatiellia bacterium]
MVKKVLVALAVAGAVVLAQAGTLYWQVADAGSFSAATLYANDGTSKTRLESSLAQGVDLETTLTGTETGLVQTSLGDYEGSQYSFLVELVTYSSGGTVTKSNWMKEFSYDDLVTGGYVAAGGIGFPTTTEGINMGVSGPNPGVIPEPSSGLLLLLGGALMALRRRRQA